MSDTNTATDFESNETESVETESNDTETTDTETTDTESIQTDTVEPTAVKNACPECSARIEIDPVRGERRCSECGLVVSESSIDRGPEWRAFDSGEWNEKARVGAPMTKLLHDEGLSTTISRQDTDASGGYLSNRKRRRMVRLRSWNRRFKTQDSLDRNLKEALGEIDRMASAMGLPKDVREMASVIYRRALEEDLLPGRSIEGVSTAAVYTAARQAHLPRSLDEVESVSRVDRLEIARTYRYVVRELGLAVEPAVPENFVPRIASEAEVSGDVERLAMDLVDEARSAEILSGRSPIGIAAAAVYAASILSNERVNQAVVAEIADVSTVTVRNRYQELLEARRSKQ